MSDVNAIKTEIREAMMRRLTGDGRDPALVFGLASTAISELLAELIFAAAKDRDHGDHLLDIVNACIMSRWRSLADKQPASTRETIG